MRLRAIHIWLVSVGLFVGSLFLPVARVSFGDVRSMVVPGYIALIGVFSEALGSLVSLPFRLFFRVQDTSLRELWMPLCWGAAILFILLSPVAIRGLGLAQRRPIAILLFAVQVVIFVLSYLGPSIGSAPVASMEFSGYRTFGAGLAILVLSQALRVAEGEPADPGNHEGRGR